MITAYGIVKTEERKGTYVTIWVDEGIRETGSEVPPTDLQ